MNYYTSLILGLAILIPAVIGLVRLSKINQAYHPFLILLWVGVLNELVTFHLISNGKSNAINNNIYYLVESTLITLQFKKWKLFANSQKLFILIIMLLVFSWILETLVISTIERFASYYIIIFSFITVLMAISMINILISNIKGTLIKNPVFIISAAFILFFTNSVIVEAFYLYGLMLSSQFQVYVVRVMTFINLFVNLTYVFAVLWIPKKYKFSRLF